MALLPLLYFPDPNLKKKALPVDEINDEIKETCANMLETMYESQGVGLAATQVNIHKRIIVLDISDDGKSPMCLINPEIISHNGQMSWQEGCLSFPGIYAKVQRHKEIKVKYQDEHGQEHTIDVDGGLLSACIQHEIDHLDGITFYDHLSTLKQKMLRSKILKMKTKRL